MQLEHLLNLLKLIGRIKMERGLKLNFFKILKYRTLSQKFKNLRIFKDQNRNNLKAKVTLIKEIILSSEFLLFHDKYKIFDYRQRR